jgi:hypothetical protein
LEPFVDLRTEENEIRRKATSFFRLLDSMKFSLLFPGLGFASAASTTKMMRREHYIYLQLTGDREGVVCSSKA